MASKRQLKKDINYVTGELITECLTYQMFHSEVSDEKIQTSLQEILDTRNMVISSVNHYEGKPDVKASKKYFKNVRNDFSKAVEVLDKLADK